MIRVKGWLRSYVPTGQASRALVVVTITDSLGTGLYLSGSVIYFVRGIGLSAGEVGLGLSLAGLAGFLASVPVGMLGDQLGAKRLLVTLQLWRAIMLVLLAFTTNFTYFLAASIGLTVAARSVSPSTQAVVASVMAETDRVSTMAIMRSVRNVGYSLGAALTIPIFAVDNRWAYRLIMLGNAATFVLAAVLLIRVRTASAAVGPAGRHRHPVRVRTAPSAISGPGRHRYRYPAGFRDWRFLSLALVNGCLSLHMSILSVGIPLWTLATGGPRWLVSLMLILNTGMAVALQVASARGSDQPGFGERALRRAAVALIACCVIFAATPLGGRHLVIALLTCGAIAMTAGELLQSAGGWELSFRHSPPGRRNEYLAAFNLGPAAQDIAGPLLLTSVVTLRSAGWLVLASLFLVAGALVRPVTRAVTKHQAALVQVCEVPSTLRT